MGQGQGCPHSKSPRSPGKSLSPSVPASPSSTCLTKGCPECHWGVTSSHHTSHTQPRPTGAARGRRWPQGWPIPAPHPCPIQRDPHSPLSQEQKEQETSLLSPVKPVRAALHLSLYGSGASGNGLAAPEWCKDSAKHCPSWRWDCQGGDTLGGKGTQMGSAGVLPLCCQSQPLEHTQTGFGRFKICIGYGDGRKGSSGASWSWLRTHPQVPKSRSVPLPPQDGVFPQTGPTGHQDATPKPPCQSLLP